MAPKRKQIDDSAAQVQASSSTRSTRASARITAAKNTTVASGAQKSTDKKDTSGDEGPYDLDTVHLAKKPRTTKSAAASKVKSTAKAPKKAAGHLSDDEPTSNSKPTFLKEASTPKLSNSTVESASAVHETNTSPLSKKTEKNEIYTPQRALELFNNYAEKDDKTVIATEGFEQLCTDATIPFDGALPLILAWQMGAKEMGKITKDEWVKGTSSLRISSLSLLSLVVTELEDLLIRGSAPIKPTSKKSDYDRSAYNAYARDVKVGFQKFYMFSYALAKPEQSKNMDMEISVALWSVLLAPKYPIMAEVLLFINNNLESYKATNKDLWSMMLEFCQTIDPNLQDYEADGAWPTLLDDFVSSKKASGNVANSSDS